MDDLQLVCTCSLIVEVFVAFYYDPPQASLKASFHFLLEETA